MRGTVAKGFSRGRVLLLVGLWLVFSVPALGQTGGPYDLSWHTVDARGGGTCSGGQFVLTCSIGQPDTGSVSGGYYQFNAGFLAGAPIPNPLVATRPSPTQRAVEVSPYVALTWRPGIFAAQQDVYLGTDFDDVNDATPSSVGIYRGQQEPNQYDPPGDFELDKTYYWRIDGVNDPCIWTGYVWRFTTANYLVVDDMESYDPVMNRIYYTWEDGIYNWTGSEVGLGIKGVDRVHLGEQCMIYAYDNDDQWGSDKYSEISAETGGGINQLQIGPDWTEAGVKSLTLFFYGDPNNDANDTEQMYVGLRDNAGLYAEVRYGDYMPGEEDMNDIKTEEWHEWSIALSDFNDSERAAVPNDLNLAGIAKLYIGFGDRRNPVAAGNGTVYFDDIRLYQPRCFPERTKPVADLSSNCVVDVADIGVMALDWLETEHAQESPANLYSAEPPDEQAINFRDYAVLMESWLEEGLWP